MHPWKKIIRGKTDEPMNKACFICLERIPCSDDDIELKMHLFTVHSAKVHLKELVEMCSEAEEREERKGWSLDDILEEERERKEAEKRRRAESGGLMGIFRIKKRTLECFDNAAEAEMNDIDCFLCQEKLIVKSSEYDEHLEKQHGVIFGLKEIKKAGKKHENIKSKDKTNINENEEAADLEINGKDADLVKELVEIKYLPKKRKIRFRTPSQRLFCRKESYNILVEEVFVNHNICFSCILLQEDQETNTTRSAEGVVRGGQNLVTYL